MKRTTAIILTVAAAVIVVVAAVIIVFWWRSPMRTIGWDAWNHGPVGMGMMREMRVAGDVDSEFGFLARMIPHHEEAVATAQAVLERSEREQMREFAEQVIQTQQREIDQMQQWLEEWYPNREADVDYEPMMRDLSELSGEQIDRAFLEDMVPHHMAAVMMAQQLLVQDLGVHSDVEDLAATIRDAQLREIRQMTDWLREWYGTSAAGGWGSGMMWR